LRALAVLGLAILAACSAGTPQGSAAKGGATEAANANRDLTGAPCRDAPRTDIAPDPGAPAPLYLYCGAKDHQNGGVAATVLPPSAPTDAAARRAVVARVASESPAGRAAARRMSCRDGSWTASAGGVDVLIKPCALNDGNWPQIMVVAALGRYVLVGEGLPAMLPALESAMARLAAYQPPEGKAPFGDPEDARRQLTAALGDKLALVGGGDLDRYSKLAENARMYNSRKNFRAAEEAYREALNIQERALGGEASGVGDTLMSLALEVSNQGRFDEAAALFRRADPLVQSSVNAADRARFFTYLAFDAANQGKFPEALRYAQAATAAWRGMLGSGGGDLAGLSVGGGDSQSPTRGELAHALNLEAAMALRVGEVANAEAAAREALEIVGEVPNLPPWWKPEILNTLGEIEARQGRLNEAETSFRGALIYRQRLFGETAPTALTLLALGRVYADEGLYPESVRSFEFALKILEKDEVARRDLAFDQIAPFLTAASKLAAKDPARRASLEAEEFRAVQLITPGVADQTIDRASVRLAAGDPAIEALVRELQQTERERDTARIELAHETSLPDEQRGALKEAALLANINGATTKSEALTAQLKQAFPAYAQLANPGAVELSELERALAPDEALALFEVGREHAFVLLVRTDRFLVEPIALEGAEIASAVNDLRKAFVVRAGAIADFDLAGAHSLYRSLFGPVEPALAGVDHLIVVPAGPLASLPPGLLVTSAPGRGQGYQKAAWLARRFATSEAPSVRAFLALRNRRTATAAKAPFFGVANPAFEGTPEGAKGAAGKPTGLELLAQHCRDAGPIPPEMLKALAPLPDTAAEAETVAKILGAGRDSLLLGSAATEAAFRARPLEDYRVIYFATHGLLPGELSCQSEPALALSPPPEPAKTKETDGLLDASEIAGLKLNAELVVLSACNTASGGGKFGGEALSGLAEAFFFAGARTLVASNWQVPSAATTRLMIGMFQRLGPDLAGGVAESLRQSQLTLIDHADTAHPFYWAAFTVVGDGARPGARGLVATRVPAAGTAASSRDTKGGAKGAPPSPAGS
jgi:CHAT domain-containing protein